MLKQSPPSSSVSASAIILGCPSRSFCLPSNCKTCALMNSVLQCSPKFSKWFTENELINIALSFFKAILESYLINLQNNLCRMHSNTVLIFRRRNGLKPVMLYTEPQFKESGLEMGTAFLFPKVISMKNASVYVNIFTFSYFLALCLKSLTFSLSNSYYWFFSRSKWTYTH